MVVVLNIILIGKSQSQLGIDLLSVDAYFNALEPIYCNLISKVVSCDAVVVDLICTGLHTMVRVEFDLQDILFFPFHLNLAC